MNEWEWNEPNLGVWCARYTSPVYGAIRVVMSQTATGYTWRGYRGTAPRPFEEGESGNEDLFATQRWVEEATLDMLHRTTESRAGLRHTWTASGSWWYATHGPYTLEVVRMDELNKFRWIVLRGVALAQDLCDDLQMAMREAEMASREMMGEIVRDPLYELDAREESRRESEIERNLVRDILQARGYNTYQCLGNRPMEEQTTAYLWTYRQYDGCYVRDVTPEEKAHHTRNTIAYRPRHDWRDCGPLLQELGPVRIEPPSGHCQLWTVACAHPSQVQEEITVSGATMMDAICRCWLARHYSCKPSE